MKTGQSNHHRVRSLSVLVLITFLIGFGPPARGNLILNESFDGTLPAPIGGWAADATLVANPVWAFAPGAGVGGGVAMQLSGTWQDIGGYMGMLYQNPSITGNAAATVANTMVAFDLKVNEPLIYGFSIGLQSWKGGWGGVATASLADIITYPDTDLPTGFKTWVLRAADPRFVQDPYSPWDGPFDPSGEIYQVLFGTAAVYSFPMYLDPPVGRFESLTIDNLRIWTVIDDLAATPAVLWSPNHKMVPVTVNYTLSDGGGTAPIVSSELSVTSNEPVNGLGDGDTAPDWKIIDAHHVLLRAERSGTGTGRIYTITVTATDDLGNQTTHSVQVLVPHSGVAQSVNSI